MPSQPSPDISPRLVAFSGFRQVAAGDHTQVLGALRKLSSTEELLRVFNDATGERIDLDLRPEADLPPSPATAEAPPTSAARRV